MVHRCKFWHKDEHRKTHTTLRLQFKFKWFREIENAGEKVSDYWA